MSLARGAVRFAVALLPKQIRGRYREQWTSDLRDADEAGISQHEIALGALAFAATVSRPLPRSWVGPYTSEEVDRRSRFAAGLAVSAALLSLARFASVNGIGGRQLGFADSLLLAFMVMAPIAAIAIVSLTKGTHQRVRLAIWLLALPLLAPVIYGLIEGDYNLHGTGGLAYLAGAAVVVVALRMLWTGLQKPGQRVLPTWRRSVLWGFAVLAVGGLGFAQATVAWVSRIPITWSWQPGFSSTMDEDGTVVRTEIYPTQADYEQWLAMEAEFELLADVTLVAYAAAGVILAVTIVLASRVLRIRAAALAGVAIGVLLVANSALLSFLGWTLATPFVSADLLLGAGQILIVAAVLHGVGGVRLSRVGHRHDVEGRVELL